MPVTYIPYAQLVIDCRLLIKQIPYSAQADLAGVVGVPRSGLLPAAIVANQLHLPYNDCYSFLAFEQQFSEGGRRLGSNAGRDGRRVLVVDDSAYAGTTMNNVRRLFEIPTPRYDFVFAAIYRSPEKLPQLDYFARDVSGPRYFEWNLINHADIASAMLDIDGVLCYDPEVYDNDGEEYEQSLIEAIPLHLTKRVAHSLCTMRINRWRPQTEEWLAQHQVKYGDLIMCPCRTAQARRDVGKYGEWKGQQYKDSSATLFIESNKTQAAAIADVSGKPVICMGNGRVYQ